MSRLTQQELRAISEALTARLAGEIDEDETGLSPEVYESALGKISARVTEGTTGR